MLEFCLTVEAHSLKLKVGFQRVVYHSYHPVVIAIPIILALMCIQFLPQI